MTKYTAILLIVLTGLTSGCRKKPIHDVSGQNSITKHDIVSSVQTEASDKLPAMAADPSVQEPNTPAVQTSPVSSPKPVLISEEPKPTEAESSDKTSSDEQPNDDTLKPPAKEDKHQAPVEKKDDKVITEKDENKQALLSDFMKQDFIIACDYVFKNFVDENGNVDYLTLRRKKSELNDAVNGIANLPTEKLISWSQDEKMAFWINAHNILTVKLIIDNYPIKSHWWAVINYPANSIKQIIGAREKMLFRVAGFQYKLEEIEEDIIKAFKDPRVCFALTYAAESGGILRNEAYDPDKLDKQLDDQVRKYLAREDNFKIDKSAKKIFLSSILKLKAPKKAFEDSEYSAIKRFRDKPAEIRAFLNFALFYLPPENIKTLAPMDFEVEFNVFDWKLNEQPLKSK